MIGLPYGSGPGEYNCWTFTQALQRQLFDRQLPDIALDSDGIRYLVKLIQDHDAHKQWKAITRPMHGGLVEMSCANLPHHVGTYLDIDGGGVVHCDACGSSFASLAVLSVLGFQRFVFYDWQG